MRYIIYIFLITFISSCSLAFKTTETPDDVYYSYDPNPLPIKEESDEYVSYWQNADDRYLRMKVRNRSRWIIIDDINYWYVFNNPNIIYNPYWNFNSWNGYFWNTWSSPFNNFNSWNNPFNNFNSWNNPFCFVTPPIDKKQNNNRVFNEGNKNNIFIRSSNSQTQNNGGYVFRTIFNQNNSNDNTNSTWSRPVRTFEPSMSNSGNGSSRSSGSSSTSSTSSTSSGGRGGRSGN